MNAQLDIFSRVSTRVSARGMERKRAGQDRAIAIEAHDGRGRRRQRGEEPLLRDDDGRLGLGELEKEPHVLVAHVVEHP